MFGGEIFIVYLLYSAIKPSSVAQFNRISDHKLIGSGCGSWYIFSLGAA